LAAFAVVIALIPVSRKVEVLLKVEGSGRRPVVKIIAESLSQHDEKHRPHLVWEKGMKKNTVLWMNNNTLGERTVTHHAGPLLIDGYQRLWLPKPTAYRTLIQTRNFSVLILNCLVTELLMIISNSWAFREKLLKILTGNNFSRYPGMVSKW
jgi:hypothetical protein